jgi:hypothetical protein
VVGWQRSWGRSEALIRCALAGEPFVVGMGRVEPVTQRSDDSITRRCGVRWRLAAAPPSHSPSSAVPPGAIGYYNGMFPLTLVIGVLSLSSGPGTGDEQAAPNPPTLIDLAREHGGVEGFSIACGPRPSFEKVVADAAVIVHGTVVAAEGRLSADEREVWTDYHVQPIQIIREGTPAPLSLPITFTARGGTVMVEGLTITQSYEELNAKLALQVGDEVVLLGTMHEKQLIVNPISAFRVRDGAEMPNGDLSGFSVDNQTVPLETFVVRVREIHPE